VLRESATKIGINLPRKRRSGVLGIAVRESSRGQWGFTMNSGATHTMPTVHSTTLLERITIDPDVRFGKPCIRGHRITVQEILEWLSGGASQEQILADYPQLEPEDFLAVYAYAAELAAERKVSKR
jgi:uncharacterized protein (DUF433 family)